MPDDHYTPLPTESPGRFHFEQEEQRYPRPGLPRQASGPTVLQANDPRFHRPTPSPLKRAVLLLFIFCLFWFAIRLRSMKSPQPSLILETERYFSTHLICNASLF